MPMIGVAVFDGFGEAQLPCWACPATDTEAFTESSSANTTQTMKSPEVVPVGTAMVPVVTPAVLRMACVDARTATAIDYPFCFRRCHCLQITCRCRDSRS